MGDSVSFPEPITVPPPVDASTIVKAANTTDTDALWGQFNKFFSRNEKTIEKCMKTDVRTMVLSEKSLAIELKIDTFSETTKVVLDGLAQLGKIHPVIGAVVVAFHAVISLDLARRDNDKKVIAIMIEMQNMICAMFQLRHLRHGHVQESEREAEKAGLHRLIESITKDITQCGSDINYYLDQKFAFKLIKAKNFESRFKAHVENFAKRRTELQTTITVYIAGGVEQANVTITEVSTKLDAVDAKLDHFFTAFLRKLDTPQEREAFRFFQQNNGVENCIEKDDLLDRFLKMTGDVLPDNESMAGLMPDERIWKSRQVLTDEVQSDFEESLKQNTLRFERLLTIQNNNHERVIAQLEKQEGYHHATASKLDKLLYYMYPDTNLKDPEVRRIWERMGLKTSVKAKTFVLTFRDHHQHEQSAPPAANSVATTSPPLVNGKTGTQSTNVDQPRAGSPEEDPDAWLLEYIDVAHVRPIVEAIDEDGSGFISVKEISTFARARPKEWSLLQWMVYWAAGWHINIAHYRNKIYDILIQMHELVPLIHPANRVYVDEYLDCHSLATIEAILRSTRDFTDKQQSQITALAQFYADTQESALRANLKEVSYVISSVADATLVTGPARAESWIYPLLYLLLEHHLEVLKLGKTTVYEPYETDMQRRSLRSVLDVLRQRKDALAAIFSQTSHTVACRFETFAYGMLFSLYDEASEIIPAKNTLVQMRTKRSTRELLLEMRDKAKEPVDNTILALKQGSPFEFEDLNVYGSVSARTDLGPAPHPLDGYWSTACRFSDGHFYSVLGLFHFVLAVAPDGSVTGSGETYAGKLHLTGTAVPSGQGSATSHSLELKMVVDNKTLDYLFHGTYDPERDTVAGSWESVPRPEEGLPEAPSAAETPGEPQQGTIQDTETGQDSLTMNNDTINSFDAIESCGQQTHAVTAFEEAQDNNNSDAPEPAQDMLTAGGLSMVEDSEGATDSDSEVQEEDFRALRQFSMRRTPADVYRFRRDLDSDPQTDSSVLARNRWKFATEATKFQVQTKNFSWQYVRARFAERRLWLDLTVGFWYKNLPSDRMELMCTLTVEYPPSQSRMYEEMADYLSSRGYQSKIGHGVNCDYCDNIIVCNRYRCITCIKDDLSDQVDRCTDDPTCIENASSRPLYDFAHTLSHTLLRSTYWIQSIHLPSLLPHCRTRSENVKKSFRILEENRKMAKKTAKASKSSKSGLNSPMEESVNVQPLHCVCCKEEVSLPCWICATCAAETAICLECERKQANIVVYDNRDTMHSHDHLLLRISDSAEVPSREVNNVRLQRELTKMTSDLRSLEQKVTTHLRTVSKVHTVLRRLTSDGEVGRVTVESNLNGVPVVTGEAGTTAAGRGPANGDDDTSDTSESVYSIDTESKAAEFWAPTTPRPIYPRRPGLIDADVEASAQVNAVAARSSETDERPNPGVESVNRDVSSSVLPIVAEAQMITPTPTNVQFFESFKSGPALSESPRDLDSSDGQKLVLEPELEPKSASVKSPAPELYGSAHHSMPTESRISALEAHIDAQILSLGTQTNTRISALEDRLSGVESQLGEILSLLKQGHS